ncbi:MAG: hypothetical protein ACI9ES_001524 [Oceanospirillaceae bacterium]
MASTVIGLVFIRQSQVTYSVESFQIYIKNPATHRNVIPLTLKSITVLSANDGGLVLKQLKSDDKAIAALIKLS